MRSYWRLKNSKNSLTVLQLDLCITSDLRSWESKTQAVNGSERGWARRKTLSNSSTFYMICKFLLNYWGVRILHPPYTSSTSKGKLKKKMVLFQLSTPFGTIASSPSNKGGFHTLAFLPIWEKMKEIL